MQETNKLIDKALLYRKDLIQKLHSENTDAYRLFHGITEGIQGLNIDRYGSLILVQTFRDALSPDDIESLKKHLKETLNNHLELKDFNFVYNHRGGEKNRSFDTWYKASEEELKTNIFKEMNIKYISKARHRGIDPLLFLDMREGRKFVLNNSENLSVLNLFSYTCGTGLCAIQGKAKEAWNIDFSESSLEIAKENAKLNNIDSSNFKIFKTDVFAAIKQLGGQKPMSRNYKYKPDIKFSERGFDLVFLDPPAWSKSLFGTVDLVRDYQSIFKPALLITNKGGRIIAVNNVAKVDLNEWVESLKRCAVKAGREIKNIEIIKPDIDFPSWDNNHPLKIAVCEV